MGLWDSGNPLRCLPNDFAENKESVVFKVWFDGKMMYGSKIMHWNDTDHVSISVEGATRMDLVVTDGGDGGKWDWSVWGDTKLIK